MIEIAKKRLAEHDASGARFKTLTDFKGVTRSRAKTVNEMAAEKQEFRKNAQGAGKGKMTESAERFPVALASQAPTGRKIEAQGVALGLKCGCFSPVRGGINRGHICRSEDDAAPSGPD